MSLLYVFQLTSAATALADSALTTYGIVTLWLSAAVFLFGEGELSPEACKVSMNSTRIWQVFGPGIGG